MTDVQQLEARLALEEQARAALERQLRHARQDFKGLLAACRAIGYHVHAGGRLELHDCPVGFVFIEGGGQLVLDPGSPAGHIEERPSPRAAHDLPAAPLANPGPKMGRPH